MPLPISHIFWTQKELHISLFRMKEAEASRKRILRFAKIEGNKFELIIQDVGGVKERVFRW